MTAATQESQSDYFRGKDLLAATVMNTFPLLGGTYGIVAAAASWNAGSLDLKVLAADGTSYISVLAAAFAANGLKVVQLPQGTYQVVITTTDNVFVSVTRIRSS